MAKVLSVGAPRVAAHTGPEDMARVLAGLIHDLERFETLVQTERTRVTRARAPRTSDRLKVGLSGISASARQALREICAVAYAIRPWANTNTD